MINTQQQQLLNISGISDYKSSDSGEMMTSCPFCKHENYKFWVSPDIKFHCWVCGVGGVGIASFISQYYNISYKESLKYIKDNKLILSSSTHESITSNELQDQLLTIGTKTIDRLSMPSLPTNTKKLLDNLSNSEVIPFLRYLKRRKMTRKDLLNYDFRYVVDGEISLGSNKKFRIYNHLIFVTHNKQGPVYWSTRSVEEDPYIKSYNAHSSNIEYSKNEVFFNMDKVGPDSNVVICEGVFNAITSTSEGYTGIATFGKNITDTQIRNIIRCNPKSFYIFLDNDAKSLAIRLITKLISFGIGLDKIHLVNNPYGNKDSNDLGKKISRIIIDSSPSITYYDMLRQKIEWGL